MSSFAKKLWVNGEESLSTPLGASGMNDLEDRVEEAIDGTAMEVWRDSAQSIPNNTLTDIVWEAGAANGNYGLTYWDSAEPEMILFRETGMYSVILNLDFASNATGYRMASILKTNWDGVASAGMDAKSAINGIDTPLRIAIHLKVSSEAAEPKVKIQVRQTSGGALNVPSNFSAERFAPVLMIRKIGSEYDRDTY